MMEEKEETLYSFHIDIVPIVPNIARYRQAQSAAATHQNVEAI